MSQSIQMTPKAKKMTILAMILLWFSFLFISSGQTGALSAKFSAIGGMDYYALFSSLNGMGMMLCMPFIGKISDIVGRKWITAVGALGYVFFWALAGLVNSVPMLLVCGFVASVMGGMYNASPIAIISDITTMEERPKYLGFISTAQATGTILGSLVGGRLTDSGHYKLALAYGIPMMVLVVVMMIIYYPNMKAYKTEESKIDVLGIILVVLGVAGVIGFTNFGGKFFPYSSVTGLSILAFGVICIVATVIVELRKPNPAVPVRLFANRSFTVSFLGNIALILYNVVFAGYVTIYALQIMQVSATMTGTFSWPSSLVLTFGGPLIGMILAKNVRRVKPMVVGSVLICGICLFVLSMLRPDSSYIIFYLVSTAGGIAVGLGNTALTPCFQRDMDPSEYGAAQSMWGFAGKLSAVIVGCLLAALSNNGFAFADALTGTFRICAIYCFAVAVLAVVLLKTPKTEE